MNTHTVRRHVRALALRQQFTQDDCPLSLRTGQEFLLPFLVRMFSLNPQLELGDKRMINLKASPKGEGFSPIPRRRH